MLQEVQRVYRLQGVEISDKHIEVIVRQMLKKVRIENNGDSEFLPGTLVDVLDFEEMNEKLAEEGKINEAENELSVGMVEDDVDYLELALTFYLYLNDMDVDFLDNNGYSREEVLDGMKELASDWGVTGLEAF